MNKHNSLSKIGNSFIAILLMGIFISCRAQKITRLDNSTIKTKELDGKIESLTKAANVHGLAITIFNNNEPVYKKTFGYKRIDSAKTINTWSNIYGASLSKAVFAVLVLKLVEEGVIELDKPLQSYLPKPIYEYKPLTRWHDNYADLKTDTLYQKITARMCLTHTTGFPNWRFFEPDRKLRVKFEPGSRYAYSGEGMVYLQVVIEKITGKGLDVLAKEKIFDPLGMKNSAYTWKSAWDNEVVYGHNTKGEIYEKDKDNEARGPSTLETTLDDYTLFTEAVLKKTILKPASIQEMFTNQIRIRSVTQFGPLSLKDSTLNDAIELGYGLGWGLLKSPYGIGAFKEGHGDGFQHYSIIFPAAGKGIIIMTNSDNGESIFRELLELTIGDKYTPWQWQNYIPYKR